MKSSFFLVLVCGISYHASAFMPFSASPKAIMTQRESRSSFVLYSSESPNELPDEELSPNVEVPSSVPQQPPTPPQRRLDPLMASLTRMDPATANAPTRKVPLLGEIPVDGSVTVLLPAAAIAVLGFIFSIVVAVNSQDEFVRILSQVSEDIADTAAQKTNMVYDENVCRGICSSQESDLEGLRGFMELLTK